MALRVRRGDAGAVRMATGTWFQDWLSRDTDYTWRLIRAESGDSNISADLGSHWFDLVQFATGPRVTEVMADFATLIPVRKKPTHPLGYHDAMLNLMRDFYDVVKADGKEPYRALPRPTFRTGYEEMRILKAGVESNRKRAWVKVA